MHVYCLYSRNNILLGIFSHFSSYYLVEYVVSSWFISDYTFLETQWAKNALKSLVFHQNEQSKRKRKLPIFFSFTFWGFLVINSSWNSVGRGRQRSTDFSSWRKCMLLKMCCVPSGSEFFFGARIINQQNFYLMYLKKDFFSKKKAWNYSQKMHRKIEVEVYTIVS